jgi:hypothetical protein
MDTLGKLKRSERIGDRMGLVGRQIYFEAY